MPSFKITPENRNKVIAVIVLGGIAVLLLSYTFFGGSKSKVGKDDGAKRTGRTQARRTAADSLSPAQLREQKSELVKPQPVNANWGDTQMPPIGRNIFSYYVPPPTPVRTPKLPPQTPTPPPTMLLNSLQPNTVYARTGEFTLEVTGDRFAPEVKLFANDQMLETRFVGREKLTAQVPGNLISGDYSLVIVARSPDGKLFTNPMTLNVMPPPQPPYTYVGYLGKSQKFFKDTAVLKEQNSNKLINASRDNTVGEWRVTNITDKSVELTHVNLRVKQSLQLLPIGSSGGGPRGGGGMNSGMGPGMVPPPPPPPPEMYEEPVPDEVVNEAPANPEPPEPPEPQEP